jgi:NFACT protein RNA binding domain
MTQRKYYWPTVVNSSHLRLLEAVLRSMVLFFTSSTGHTLYMGRDKHENEDLIRYGLPEDVWFHVDNLSSAHVYLRMAKGEKLKELAPELIMECCHLVKARENRVSIIL